MRFQLPIAALFMACTAGSGAFSAEQVGVRDINVFSPQRNSNLEVTVWYPSAGDGEKTLVSDNRIFQGSQAFKDATIKTGQFPLVLLSHGSGSRVEGMAWIAVKLAEAGFIVAGTNHPGTTSGYSTPQDTPKIWERDHRQRLGVFHQPEQCRCLGFFAGWCGGHGNFRFACRS